MMDSADQAIELQELQEPQDLQELQEPHDLQDQSPNPYELLLEHLMNENYGAFESLATEGLENNPLNIDIDYVFPPPVYKTVLDIACANGLEKFVELILNLGANPNKKNVAHQRSPLHFAAEAGNLGVLKILLTHSEIEPNLEVDRKTALHLAVSNKKVECVEVLLEHNADRNIADRRGLTPLHVAAMTGHEGIVKLLIHRNDTTPGANVRCVDECGNTALHYAAMAKSSEVISLLLKAGSYIGHENAHGNSPITDIDPETISRYLDDCLWTNEKYIYSFTEYKMEFISQRRAPRVQDYEIEFDYKCLSPIGVTNNICMEMQPLLHIAQSNSHRHLLKHPILSSFLYLKWECMAPFLYTNFILYLIFYAVLNSYILNSIYFTEVVEVNTLDTNESIDNETSSLITRWNPRADGKWYSLAIVLVILVLREMVQLISSPRDYFLNSENWLEFLLICLSIAVLGEAGASVGALAILLSAWKLIILLRLNSLMSTAIEMFKTVTCRFILFLSFYAPLIIAFAFAFYTLFKDCDESSFSDFGYSFFKTVIMLTGEFDADEIPFVSHPILSHMVFVVFVFLIAIVLFNLLNGLAVSDTAKILSEAELGNLILRTKLAAYAESIFVGSPIPKNRWCCRWSGFRQPMKISPIRFLFKNILFFPDFLPDTKIRVKPFRRYAVIIGGKAATRNTCWKLKMDPDIITDAEGIISWRGRVSDYQKILATVNQRFDKIEALIRNFNQPEKENNNKNNYESD